MRQDLRYLVALEAVQMGMALVILVSVAVEAVITAAETAVAVYLGAAVTLALVLGALALRVRVGQTLLYRDVYALEGRPRRAPSPRTPYRSPSPPESPELEG